MEVVSTENMNFISKMASTTKFNTQDPQEDNKLTDLLFDKHVDYVVNHGNDKNDFVSCKISIFVLSPPLNET